MLTSVLLLLAQIVLDLYNYRPFDLLLLLLLFCKKTMLKKPAYSFFLLKKFNLTRREA
jgi:hypothetical protein